MKIAANIVAVLLLLIGGLWTLRGLNVIGGSYMSGQSQWLWTGIVALVAGLGVLYWFNLRRRG